ncbi:hypothetical protein LQW54_003897 [Pestalotiopsis sp. IQ-011]
MVYKMTFYVDGGCRWNGQPHAIGAAAACLDIGRSSDYWSRTEILPDSPTPTSSRAEITAVIIALKWAIEKRQELRSNPYIIINIHSDSQNVVDWMIEWIDWWSENGWFTVRGTEVADKDLFLEARALEDQLYNTGNCDINYWWIPREDNYEADKECNRALDEKEGLSPYESSEEDEDFYDEYDEYYEDYYDEGYDEGYDEDDDDYWW